MRWMFASTPVELAHKREMLGRIDAFWKALTPRLGEIGESFNPGGPEFPNEWMHSAVNAVDERIMWEYGPPVASDGVARLVLTCEVERHLRPMVSAMIARAPDVPGWSFHPYRQRGDMEAAEAFVVGRAGGSINGWRVKVGRSESKVNLTYLVPGIEKTDSELAIRSAFVATECLLGEQLLDQWVGVIDAAPLRPIQGPSHTFKKLVRRRGSSQPATNLPGYELTRLHSLVCSLIDAHQEQLPNIPWHQTLHHESPVWRAELEVATRSSRMAFDDPILVTESIRGLIDQISTGFFNSSVFSKCGERFVGVKCFVGNGMSQEALAAKVCLYDALNHRLREQGLGCAVGASSGERHN